MCTTHIIVKLPQTLVILVIIFTFIKTTEPKLNVFIIYLITSTLIITGTYMIVYYVYYKIIVIHLNAEKPAQIWDLVELLTQIL